MTPLTQRFISSVGKVKHESTISVGVSAPLQKELATNSLSSSLSRVRPLRMVIGVTSDQTCLVLKRRLTALREAGFEVTLVASPGKLLNQTARAEGVVAWPVKMARDIDLLSDMASFLKLCWILFRVRPVITDFSTPKAGLLGNMAAWLMRVPHRVYTLRGLKLESSVGFKRRVLLRCERVAAWCSQVVLCNSISLKEAAVALGVAPPKKFRMLGSGSSNGVDLDRFYPGESPIRGLLGIAESDLVIGFVGRLTKNKGVPELLQAFDEILLKEPNCWLMLVGWFDAAEDRLGRRWRSHIAAHPRIRLTGYVDEPAHYYRAMDLLVHPTHREGFPNVVIEAGACGIPAITSECTGARNAVVPEITGLLIPPGAPAFIVDAVLELLASESKRRRMGIAAQAWVGEQFSNKRVLDLAVDFYRELVTN